MNDISNYEYTVLKRLQDAGGCIVWSSLDTETATACAQLAGRNLVFNGVAEVDGVLKTAAAISPSGLLAVLNYKYDAQLERREVWSNRFWGFVFGVLTSSTVWFLTIVLPALLRSIGSIE